MPSSQHSRPPAVERLAQRLHAETGSALDWDDLPEADRDGLRARAHDYDTVLLGAPTITVEYSVRGANGRVGPTSYAVPQHALRGEQAVKRNRTRYPRMVHTSDWEPLDNPAEG